jgi:hypothetical protein
MSIRERAISSVERDQLRIMKTAGRASTGEPAGHYRRVKVGTARLPSRLAAGAYVTANDPVPIGSELARGRPGACGGKPPPSGAPSSSRSGRFSEPTRRYRRPGEDAALPSRRSGARYPKPSLAVAESTTHTVDQRRSLEPINDVSGVLLQAWFDTLTSSLTEVLHHHDAPLRGLNVLDSAQR